MGRKVNPLIFRSKYKYKQSNWVVSDGTYNKFLKEDYLLRNFIKKFFNAEGIEVNSIYIFRKNISVLTNKVALYIVIYLSKQRSKKTFNKVVYLKNLILKQFCNINIPLHIKLLESGERNFISEKFINFVNKLKQTTSTKLVISNFILSLKKVDKILGAKVVVKGRINGSEKARVLKDSFGVINLQRIKSKVGFLSQFFETKDGLTNVILIYNLK